MMMRVHLALLVYLLCASSWAQSLAAPPAAAPPAAVTFVDELAPPPPDYSRPGSWAARPGREGTAAARPAGDGPADRGPTVDVFYVHPTTYRSADRWNQPLDDAATNEWTDRSVIARQASIFNGCCRIFAPRYRQASTRAFAAMAGDGGRAYARAYGDVLRAFDWYMAHDNGGRPFILVGHSQGAFHVFNLLKDRVEGRPARRRFVVAYLPGYGVVDGDFGTHFKTLRPCTAPRQTACMTGWNSFLDGSDATDYVRRTRQRFVEKHGTGPGARLMCSDPLSLAGGRQRTGRGALPAGEGVTLPALVPGAVSAACDADGVLKVKVTPSLGLAPLPGGNMHYHDMALFYAELRDDARRRSAAFRR